MGYVIKVQKVERPTNRSYYVNLPVVLAEAIQLQKGDEWEWLIEDKTHFALYENEITLTESTGSSCIKLQLNGYSLIPSKSRICFCFSVG